MEYIWRDKNKNREGNKMEHVTMECIIYGENRTKQTNKHKTTNTNQQIQMEHQQSNRTMNTTHIINIQ